MSRRNRRLALAVLAALALQACDSGPQATGADGRAENVAVAQVGLAGQLVDVGPGVVDASVRQVVRTRAGRAYIFAADDTAQKNGVGPGVIRAWRGSPLGIPTAFSERDGAHRPSATGTHVLGSPDVRLDRRGIARLLYVNEGTGNLLYRTFSTVTNRWGRQQIVARNVNVPTKTFFLRAETANALVLDANDVLRVVYTAGDSVYARRKTVSGWSRPTTIATDSHPIHPQLAASRNGSLYLTWLDQGSGSPRIRFARRTARGWGAREVVAKDSDPGGVLTNDTLDQGPSIIVTAQGTPYVVYLDDADHVQVKFRSNGSWRLRSPPALFAHTPQIYSRRSDVYVFLGHDDQIRFGYVLRPSGGPWSAYKPLTTTAQGTFDGSASIRWDPLHEPNSNLIDATFFDEDRDDSKSFLPELYYMAVRPS